MVVDVVINAQRTMIHTLCINVAWCCGEPVSYVLRHFVISTFLHCPKPTVRPFPLLAGRVPRLPRLPRWPPFPQGPRTPPPHRPLHEVICFFFIQLNLMKCFRIMTCWRFLSKKFVGAFFENKKPLGVCGGHCRESYLIPIRLPGSWFMTPSWRVTPVCIAAQTTVGSGPQKYLFC